MNYFVKGHFYKISINKNLVTARSILTITNNKLEEEKYSSYDLLVVMMNPGGSEPKTKTDWFSKPTQNIDCLVDAIPDDTQLQIMKVMDRTGFQNAIILNLSDICETTSSKFAKDINELEYLNIGTKHSIFSNLRNEDLSIILNSFSGNTVILASGVNYKLRFLTKQMLDKIKYPNIVSIQHENGQFYHPLPRVGQEEWVSEIVKKLS